MRSKAEIFDQVQRLFDVNGFNDHQLHCVFRFDPGSAPDAANLRKALIATIEAIPILGTRYVDGAEPYWESLDRSDLASAFVIAETATQFETFLVQRSDEERGPQVRVCLLDASPAAIAITLNHMICDAAAFKLYTYFLCKVYSQLAVNPAYTPRSVDGDRGLRGVVRRFAFDAKVKSLFQQGRDNNQTGDRRFPMDEGQADAPFIATRRLTRERTSAVKAYARLCGATLNDMALAAFYRSLFRELNMRLGDRLAIPIMVDMRRYLKNGDAFTSLTNLTSMVASELDCRPDEAFVDTLRRVKAGMDAKKDRDIGLNAFIKLDLLFGVFGDRIATRILRTRLKDPLICMTNIGVLDEARLSFGGLQAGDVFMCGSIKYRPYFQLAVSTYRDEMTFSINLYGGAGDRQRVDAFLQNVETQLLAENRSAACTS
jgi:NRPS condensation-like uncharacterized protein